MTDGGRRGDLKYRSSTRRQIDNMEKSSEKPRDRQIVGFSLSPAMAAAVKMEAARRKLSLRKLFEELWEGYEANKKP